MLLAALCVSVNAHANAKEPWDELNRDKYTITPSFTEGKVRYLKSIEIIVSIRRPTGEVLWFEVYQFGPKKGVEIKKVDSIAMILSFYKGPVIAPEYEDKLRLIRHDVLWNQVARPESKVKSPDGM
jgi:hypothetical protein